MFYFGVTFKDDRVDALFDLARLVLEPEFSRKTHITLRGPYRTKPKNTSKWFDHDVGSVTLSRPGNFFQADQNTVFIRCEIPFVKDIWHKPDYQQGTPHLTLYDGDSRRFAWMIMNELRKYEWNLTLKSSKLQIISSKQRIETKYLVDGSRIDGALADIAAKKYNIEKLKYLHEGQRVYLLGQICRQIHFLTHPSLALI